MPRGPNGERRPADTNACAVSVARIATGEAEDNKAAKRGSAGGKARAERMSAQERKEIAKRAAGARWNNNRRRDMTDSTQQTLAERYKKSQTDGVIDVKFLLKNEQDFGREEAVAEDQRLYDAFVEGRYETLDFGDLKWKD